jgi:hypothetical protein
VHTIAIYIIEQAIVFLKSVQFKTKEEADAFKLACHLNARYSEPNSDTNCYLKAYCIPEDLAEVIEFDDECEWLNGVFTPGDRHKSTYYENLLRKHGEF